MTYAELAEAVMTLSLEERRRLLEVIARSLREEEARRGRPAAAVCGLFNPNRSALEQLRGIARPADPLLTDEEIRELYTDYLIEKHQ